MKEDKKKSIAVIGDEELTLGFQLAGVQKAYEPESLEDYREKIVELLETEDIGIVVAEQSDVQQLPDRIRVRVEESVDPVVVALSEDTGISGLEEKIQNVIGINIS